MPHRVVFSLNTQVLSNVGGGILRHLLAFIAHDMPLLSDVSVNGWSQKREIDWGHGKDLTWATIREDLTSDLVEADHNTCSQLCLQFCPVSCVGS